MTERPTFNILISGVGGQGVVLASYVLSRVALAEGYDVKQSEVHGMAQRGGCVTSHLRFGDRVYSSLITPGTVDVLLSFESVEAMRYVHWLKPGGLLVYNAARVNPSTVSSGAAEYPEGIEERIAEAWPTCAGPSALAARPAPSRRPTSSCSARWPAPCPSPPRCWRVSSAAVAEDGSTSRVRARPRGAVGRCRPGPPHHVGISVADLDESIAWYEDARVPARAACRARGRRPDGHAGEDGFRVELFERRRAPRAARQRLRHRLAPA